MWGPLGFNIEVQEFQVIEASRRHSRFRAIGAFC